MPRTMTSNTGAKQQQPKKRPQKRSTKAIQQEEAISEYDFDLKSDLDQEENRNEETPFVSKTKRRKYNDDEEQEEEEEDFGPTGSGVNNEVKNLLECFGADISKSLITKRKRLEGYTSQSMKASTKKMEEIWKTQLAERQKMGEEYNKKIIDVFQQWDQDIEKIKEQEEKLQTIFKQQQKLSQQSRIIQAQRLKSVRQLHEQFTKNMGDLDSRHQSQQGTINSELRKELSLLQKKILMETQNQGMANVKKSLQSILF